MQKFHQIYGKLAKTSQFLSLSNSSRPRQCQTSAYINMISYQWQILKTDPDFHNSIIKATLAVRATTTSLITLIINRQKQQIKNCKICLNFESDSFIKKKKYYIQSSTITTPCDQVTFTICNSIHHSKQTINQTGSHSLQNSLGFRTPANTNGHIIIENKNHHAQLIFYYSYICINKW